jgi:hypothetical protein
MGEYAANGKSEIERDAKIVREQGGCDGRGGIFIVRSGSMPRWSKQFFLVGSSFFSGPEEES